MKTLQQIQTEVGEWSKRNFGNQSSWKPLIGLVEEYSELVDARDSFDSDKVEDGLGDIGIYLCDFCSRERIFLSEHYWKNSCDNLVNQMLFPLGALCHHFLKREQNIRTEENHNLLVAEYAQQILEILWRIKVGEKDFLTILNETWEKVSKRDWAKNKVTG
jgi:NTP pyrophosphatase (non-canonical NTP hydrolase)